MGVSTDAILFYGFELTDEEGGEVCDLEYFLTGEETEDWWECIVKSRTGKSSSDWGVEFGCHCCEDAPLWYVCVEAVGASRGETVEIKPDDLLCYQHGDPKDIKLKAFCDAMSIEYKQPAWWLVSWWG